MKIEFFVPGTPAPGGSKNGFPFKRADGSLGVRMVDAGKGNAQWKKVVALIGKTRMNRMGLQPLDCALRFSAEFVMPRGKTVKRAQHTIAPDLSKLIRSTEDGLTGIVWVDDAQIVEHGPMAKRYAMIGEQTGARIVAEVVGAVEQELALPAVKAAPSPPPEPVLDSPFD